MADRYWVGGTAIWDTTAGTKWATTSGGAGGAAVPTVADSVFFDQASTYTVTMTGALACLNMNVTAGTVSFVTGTTPTLTVAGNWSTIAGTVWSMTGVVTFTATTAKTINTNGVTISSPFTLNGTGGSWTLQNNLTLASTATTTLTAGTLALDTYTLSTGLFASASAVARTINFGTGKIVLNSATTSTVWNTSTITNLTVTGTSLVECIGGGTAVTKTISAGALSEANAISFSLLETTGTVTYAFTAANTINNLIVNGSQTISNIAILIYGSFTHTTTNGTTTFTAGANAWTFAATSGSDTITPATSFTYDFPWTFGSALSTATWTLADSVTLGSTRTLTLTTGTLSLSTFTFTTGLFSSAGAVARTLNFGTGKIILNSATTSTVWNTSTITNLTISGTSLVECQGGGTAVTKTISAGTLSEANAINFSLLETTGTVTYAFTASNTVKNLIVNGLQTISNIAITIYGIFTHLTTNGTTTFTGGTNAWTYAATSGSQNITTISDAGINDVGSVIFNGGASGDLLSFPASSTAYNLSGASWTVECWIYPTISTFSDGQCRLLIGGTNNVNTAWVLGLNTNYSIGFNVPQGAPVSISTAANSIQRNKWQHIAVVSNAGTSTIYIDGVQAVTPITTLTKPVSGSIGFKIGYDAVGTVSTQFSGFISEVRINTTTAVYTGAFTPPTLAALATSGSSSSAAYPSTTNVNTSFAASTTTLLTCQSTSLFVDNSNGALAVTRTGSPVVSIASASVYSYNFPWIFGSASSTATWTLVNNTTLSRQVTLVTGTLDFNNKILSSLGFTINNTVGTSSITNTGGPGSLSLTVPITHTTGTLTLPFNLTTTNILGYTFTAGTLSLSSYTLTTPVFSSANANARTIAFGTGKIVINSTTTSTVWTTSTVTNLSITGTSLVEFQGGGTGVTKTINTGVLTAAQAINFSLIETTGTATYTFTAANAVKNLIVNGVQTISNIAITIYGDFTHTTTNGTTTFTAGVNAWTFAATSGSYNITNIAGFTYDFPWTFGSAASTATWTLANNLTLGATRQLNLTNGTFDMNNKTISAAGFTIVTGTPTLANTGGSSPFTTALPFTHTSGTFTLPFAITITSTSGYTLTAGTLSLSTFTLTTTVFSSANANVRTLNFGTGKIVLNGTAAATIWNTSTITSLTVSGTPLVECQGGGTGVIKTISPGALSEANAISFSLLETTGTVTYTITSATSNVKNLIVNGSQTLTNSNIGIFGTFTHLTSNGTTTFTAGANSWIFAATSGSYSIGNITGFTYDFPWTFGSATASTATWTLSNNLTMGATRVIVLTNGTFDVNNKTVTVAAGFTISTGSATLNNTGGTTLSITGIINHTSGTLTLGTNLTTTAATGYTLTAGTLSLGTKTLTVPVFVSNNTNVRTLAFGTGQLALTGNAATIFDITTATNFFTTGTVYINCTYTGATGTRTIVTGFTEVQAVTGYNISTSGTTGIVLSPSATDTVALTGSFASVDFTGFTGTLSNTARTIYGFLIVPSSGGTYTAGTLTTTFASTGTLAGNITTNGRTLDFPFTFNGAGGSFTLQTNFISGSTRTITLNAGTLNLNNFTLTAGFFSSSAAVARTLAFGSTGQFSLGGNGGTIFDVTTATNFTTTGTVYINCTYTGATGTRTFVTGFTEAQAVGYDVATSGTAGIVLSPSATDIVALTGGFEDVNLTNFTGTLSNTARTVYGNLTIPSSGGTFTAGTLVTTFAATSSKTITGNGRTLDFPITFNGVGGSWALQTAFTTGATRTLTLTTGTLNLNDLTLTTGFFSSSGSVTRTLAFGTGQLALAGNGATIFDVTTATLFTTTGTPYVNCTYTGATGTRTIVTGFSEAQSVGYDVATSGTTGIVLSPSATDIVALTGAFEDINLTGFTGTLSNTTRTIYGSWTNPVSGGTYTSGTLETIFTSSSSENLTTNGRILDFPIRFATNGALSFNGSTQYLTVSSTPFDFTSSSSCTIECWIYVTSNTAGGYIFQNYTTGGASGTGQFFGWSSNSLFFAEYNGSFAGAAQFQINSPATLSINTWYHVAVVKSGTGSNNIKMYVNGQLVVTGTLANFAVPGSSTTYIGARNFNGIKDYFPGYISNLRIVKDVAVYTDTFTPSTTPLSITQSSGTNIAAITSNQTSLLLADASVALTYQTDSSNYGFTIGGTGASFVYASPFTSSTTWTLQTALLIGPTRTTTLSSGILNLNNYTLTTGLFNSSFIGARTLAFSSTGQLALVGSGTTIFDITTATNFSTTGTVYVNSTYALSVGTRTFVTGFTEVQAGAGYSVSTSGTTGIVLSPSATDIVALTGSYNNVNLTGFIGTLSNTARTVYGNWTNPASGGTYTAGALVTTFGATSSKTITTNGRTLDFALTFDGVGGTWTLQDNLTIGSTRNLGWNNGTLDLNNKTLSNPTSITINGGASGSFTLANTGGTSYTTTALVSHTTGTLNINLPITTSGSYTLTAGAIILNSTLNTAAFTWTAGTITLNSYTLTCTTWASTSTTARTFAFGTGNLTVTGSGASLFNMTGATNHVVTGTPNVNITNSTATATSVVPGVVTEAQSLNFIFSGGAYALTFLGTASHAARSITFSGGWAGTWAATAACTIYGSLTLVSTLTLTVSASAMTFGGTSGTKTITTATKTIPFPLTFNGIGSTFQLVDSLTTSAAVTLTNGTFDGNNQTISGVTAFSMVTGTATIQNVSTALAFTLTSGTLNLGSACSFGAYTFTATTLNLSSYTLTCTTWTSTSTTARTLAFGTGNITVTASGACFNMLGATNITVTGTPNVNITNSTTTATSVVSGVLTEAQSMNFIFSGGAYTLTFLGTASHAARDINFTNFTGTWAAIAACTVYGNVVLGASTTYTSSASALTLGATSSKTITTNYNAFSPVSIPFPITFNGVGGSWALQDTLLVASTVTLTAGTLNLNGQRLSPNFFSASGSTVRNIIFSGASDILCLGLNGTLFTTATATNLTVTGTPNVVIYPQGSGAVTVASSGTEAQSFNFSFYEVAPYTLTFLGTAGYSARNVDFSNFTGTLAATSTGTIYGSVILNGSMTLTTSASAMTLGGTSGIQTFDSNGKAIPFPINLNASGATKQLTDAFTLATVSTTFTHTNGTLDLNGYTATVGLYTTATGTKNLTFTNGTLVVAGSGVTAFNNAVPTGYTTTDASGTGKISLTSSTAKTFVGGGSTYNCAVSHDGTGVLTFTGSSSFRSITTGVAAASFIFTIATTQTVTSWDVNGTAGNLVVINSSTSGTLANISKTGGGGMDYVSIADIAFQPCSTNGSGALPMLWAAGTNSTNRGNNFGIVFEAYDADARTYAITLTSVTSWTVPADWNSSDNTIHLIGGGGGAAGSRTSGGLGGGPGGGGGGYTKILNYSSAAGTVVSTTIGAAGTAGGPNGSGGAGGSTVFGSYSAGGGGAGVYGTGGAGGTGSTYNGGKGGLGSNYSGSGGGGGGGGGAGGPNGAGAQGGDNYVTNGSATGGGGNGGGYPGTTTAGGNGWLNTGGGTNAGFTASAGTLGTGGGAGPVPAFRTGQPGGSGFDIYGFIGSGGGGGSNQGGSGGGAGGAGGNYGAGGGGAGVTAGANPSTYNGGPGAQGLIVIRYYVATATGNTMFFAFF